MNNNDKFRRIRFIFNVNEFKMLEIFKSANHLVTKDMIDNWLVDNHNPRFQKLPDVSLAIFLNGLITEKRGRREGPQAVPEQKLNNNMILKKLKIAFNLKTDDILDIFKSIDKDISAHELSAFLRNPSQNQYRQFNDQYLRFFLKGLQIRYRNK